MFLRFRHLDSSSNTVILACSMFGIIIISMIGLELGRSFFDDDGDDGGFIYYNKVTPPAAHLVYK